MSMALLGPSFPRTVKLVYLGVEKTDNANEPRLLKPRYAKPHECGRSLPIAEVRGNMEAILQDPDAGEHWWRFAERFLKGKPIAAWRLADANQRGQIIAMMIPQL